MEKNLWTTPPPPLKPGKKIDVEKLRALAIKIAECEKEERDLMLHQDAYTD